jgi:D-arabinose 1-dehydrogenase-like Zn-dependent alcohol dehydrogenase
MKSMVIRSPGEPLLPETRGLPEPRPRQVRVRIHACGICHSDRFVTQGLACLAGRSIHCRNARVQGRSSGTATDSTDAMAFAAKHGVRPRIETFPLADSDKALRTMMEGTVRFRAVLEAWRVQRKKGP